MTEHKLTSVEDGSFDLTKRYVRFVNERSGFVEFEFAIGEPEIFIEMILSKPAFEEFCAQNQVEMLDPEDGRETPPQSDDEKAWAWRLSDATKAKD